MRSWRGTAWHRTSENSGVRRQNTECFDAQAFACATPGNGEHRMAATAVAAAARHSAFCLLTSDFCLLTSAF